MSDDAMERKQNHQEQSMVIEIGGITAIISHTPQGLKVICQGQCPVLTGCRMLFCPVFKVIK